MSTDQLPPADELFEVRARLKELGERETALRNLMLADPSARTGNKFAVEIQEVTTARVDVKELRENYPDIISQFTFPIKTPRIMLREISEDGELLSLRRHRKENDENLRR